MIVCDPRVVIALAQLQSILDADEDRGARAIADALHSDHPALRYAAETLLFGNAGPSSYEEIPADDSEHDARICRLAYLEGALRAS